MRMESLLRTGALAGAIMIVFNVALTAQERDTKEPIVRVTKNIDARPADAIKPNTRHPLDPALRLAQRGLDHLDKDVVDYTATLVRRERIDGLLKEAEFSKIKVRNPRVDEQGNETPFSIYMGFTKPAVVNGRECIYVEGQNDNKLIAHEAGAIIGRITVHLDPDGSMAMKGNRYPIYMAGLRNLIVKLLEKGNRDRQRDECEVKFFKGAKIDGRTCTVMQVVHPEKRDYFDFHKVQIFIDDELQLPIRYASWSWPGADGKPVLEEEYTYVNLKLNVGLTDMDFSPTNPEYNFK